MRAIPLWVWEKVLKNSTLWTVLSTVVIAIATVAYTSYAKKQWGVISDQLDVMKLGHRPWLGIQNDITLTKHPQITVNPGPAFIAKADQNLMNIAVQGTAVLINTGLSPALNEHMEVIAVPAVPVAGPYERPTPKCSTDTETGNVIFPGNSTIPVNTSTPTAIPKSVGSITFTWLVGCVSYTSDAKDRTHYYKFWFRSEATTDPGQWTGDTVKYFPIGRYVLYHAEAD